MSSKDFKNPAVLRPPFNLQSAIAKVQAAEDAWNSRDPQRVAMAYSENSEWRNRSEFINGREKIREFLAGKWQKELNYRLKKELWSFKGNRIAVSFFYEWQNLQGDWFRSFGNELWQFSADGLMERRIASINDMAIKGSDRKLR